MKQYVERYRTWFEKTVANLEKSKGAEGKVLRARFQTLALREDILGCLHHANVLHEIVTEFSNERKNLRWVEKFKDDCERWSHLFDCSVRLAKLEPEVIIQALIESQIDVEFAINLS